MSLAVFSPYGLAQKETGFLMVLARYLETRGYGVMTFRCNGVLPRCGRDQHGKIARSAVTCVDCMKEQELINAWGGFSSLDISPYFSNVDFKDHQIRLAQLGPKAFDKFICEGIKVQEISGATLRVVNESVPEKDDLLLAGRIISACARLINERPLDGLLMPVGDDFLLKSMATVAERKGVKLFRFRWDQSAMIMHISGGEYSEFKSNLFFEDIASMRANVDSWPMEIQTHLKEVEDYLGVTQQQLSLPIV